MKDNVDWEEFGSKHVDWVQNSSPFSVPCSKYVFLEMGVRGTVWPCRSLEGDEVGSAMGPASGELPWGLSETREEGEATAEAVSVPCVGSPDAGREAPQETRSFAV